MGDETTKVSYTGYMGYNDAFTRGMNWRTPFNWQLGQHYSSMSNLALFSERFNPAAHHDFTHFNGLAKWHHHNDAYPFSLMFDFGRGPKYADISDYDYRTALGLQGVDTSYMAKYALQQQYAGIAMQGDFTNADKLISANLTTAKEILTIGKNEPRLADRTELQAQLAKLEADIKAQEEEYNEIVGDKELSDTDRLKKLQALKTKTATTKTTAEALYKVMDKIMKAIIAAEKQEQEEKAKQEAEANRQAADDATRLAASDQASEAPTAPTAPTDNAGYEPPPAGNSDLKTKVTEKGTKVSVKYKGKDGAPAGKFYEYNGEIYQVTTTGAEPVKVTDQVEKITK